MDSSKILHVAVEASAMGVLFYYMKNSIKNLQLQIDDIRNDVVALQRKVNGGFDTGQVEPSPHRRVVLQDNNTRLMNRKRTFNDADDCRALDANVTATAACMTTKRPITNRSADIDKTDNILSFIAGGNKHMYSSYRLCEDSDEIDKINVTTNEPYIKDTATLGEDDNCVAGVSTKSQGADYDDTIDLSKYMKASCVQKVKKLTKKRSNDVQKE